MYRPLFGHDGGRLTGPVLQTQASSQRSIVNILMATVPRLLKLRYLVLGGAISGGAAMSKVSLPYTYIMFNTAVTVNLCYCYRKL